MCNSNAYTERERDRERVVFMNHLPLNFIYAYYFGAHILFSFCFFFFVFIRIFPSGCQNVCYMHSETIATHCKPMHMYDCQNVLLLLLLWSSDSHWYTNRMANRELNVRKLEWCFFSYIALLQLLYIFSSILIPSKTTRSYTNCFRFEGISKVSAFMCVQSDS